MEDYYTPQEVADKLKVNTRTLYRWIHEGKLKAVKLCIEEVILLCFGREHNYILKFN